MSSYIIAGSRTITNYSIVQKFVNSLNLEITEIVSGAAKGIDTLGAYYALNHNIPVKEFPAQWDKFGRSAGYRRNLEMAQYVKDKEGGLILIWDGISRGSFHMKNIAGELNIPIYEQIITEDQTN